MEKIKGLSKLSNRYRVRLSSGTTFIDKSFNFKDFPTEENCFLAAKAFLLKEQENLKDSAEGKTSKYKRKQVFSSSKLKEYLHYDPETGIFTWLKSEAVCISPGLIAGTPDNDGYILIRFLGITYKAHRLAFAYMTGKLPPSNIDVDHINRVTGDNRWCNLRLASRSENQCNKIALKSALGIKGLLEEKNYYRAVVYKNRTSHIARFPKTEEGKQAALIWLQNTRNKLHKEFARHA